MAKIGVWLLLAGCIIKAPRVDHWIMIMRVSVSGYSERLGVRIFIAIHLRFCFLFLVVSGYCYWSHIR